MKNLWRFVLEAFLGVLVCGIIMSNVSAKQSEPYTIAESKIPDEDRVLRIVGVNRPVAFGPQTIAIEVNGVSTKLSTKVWNDGGVLVEPKITWEGKIAHIIIRGCEQKDASYVIDCSNPDPSVITFIVDE